MNLLGLTFKEDCADLRNSKVVDIVRELESYGVEVFVHDPHADFEEAQREHAVHLHAWDSLPVADALVLAVAHGHYRSAGLATLACKLKDDGCIVDVKSMFPKLDVERSGRRVWRL